jgi:hypothetical protein
VPNTAGTEKWTAGDPFTGVQSYYYWSGTSFVYTTRYAWYVAMNGGYVLNADKASNSYVWPVRGGN